jgi:hypothetical protein
MTVLAVSENTVQAVGLDVPWTKVQLGKQQRYAAPALLALGRFSITDESPMLYTRAGSGNQEHYEDKLLLRHVATSGIKEFPQQELLNNSFAAQVLIIDAHLV